MGLVESPSRSRFLFEHDLRANALRLLAKGKPLHTFPDHAPVNRAHAPAICGCSSNCDTYHWVYQRNIHGIGIRNMQATANTIVRHNTSRPEALNTISRRVPLTLRQFQRIQAVMTQAQPTMVMKETYIKRCQPT